MTIAAELARLVNNTQYEDLPASAIDHAAMMIASTIASAAMGQTIRSARIVRELVKEQGGTPEATIWFDNGSGAKLPAVNAARANALASDAAASDDSDLRTIAHLGTQLTSATLALAEKNGASGKDALAAFVPAYEVAGRIAAAIIPHYRNQGFHGSLAVIFASAVASGRLLKLDDAQMTQAIAMAAVSMGGLGTAADTSEAREYFAGNAALGGINAAYAAQKGYEVEANIFETQKGFLEVYGGKDADAASLTRDWGREWDIVTDMGIKLVPGGHPSHALGEAAANAARDADVGVNEIESIVMTQPLNPKLRTGVMKPPAHPKNLVDIAHTPAYFVAAGVADKQFSWIHASDAKIHDPVIHALIDKIKIGEPITQDVDKYMHGARVTLNTKSGKSYTSTVYAPRGSGARGIDWKDVDDKYRTLVALTGASVQKMNDTLDVIHNLRDAPDVSKLIGMLR